MRASSSFNTIMRGMNYVLYPNGDVYKNSKYCTTFIVPSVLDYLQSQWIKTQAQKLYFDRLIEKGEDGLIKIAGDLKSDEVLPGEHKDIPVMQTSFKDFQKTFGDLKKPKKVK